VVFRDAGGHGEVLRIARAWARGRALPSPVYGRRCHAEHDG
jgi:hypothetical protein